MRAVGRGEEWGKEKEFWEEKKRINIDRFWKVERRVKEQSFVHGRRTPDGERKK